MHRQRIRLFSFAVLVLFMLHMCGASGQVIGQNTVTWDFGPCALRRPMGSSALTVVCYQRDLVRLWPPPGVQAAAIR